MTAEGAGREALIERLADAEHASWSRWMEYLFGCCEMQQDGSLVIPADKVRHWDRQIRTPYADLTEREKESDRKEVAVILTLIEDAIREDNQRLRTAIQTYIDAESGHPLPPMSPRWDFSPEEKEASGARMREARQGLRNALTPPEEVAPVE